MPSETNPLPPRNILRLAKLWPHARKQGHERGQIYRVGYYCRHCGLETIWFVAAEGQSNWTADREFVRRHFEIVELSSERSLYGRGKAKLGPLEERN